MSKTSMLIDKLSSAGFVISEDNSVVNCNSAAARKVVSDYYSDATYILGSIPSASENIYYVEFDIMFNEIEFSYPHLSSEAYDNLHEFAQKNDIISFKNDVYSTYGPVGIFKDIVEGCLDFQKQVIDELNLIDKNLRLSSLHF